MPEAGVCPVCAEPLGGRPERCFRCETALRAWWPFEASLESLAGPGAPRSGGRATWVAAAALLAGALAASAFWAWRGGPEGRPNAERAAASPKVERAAAPPNIERVATPPSAGLSAMLPDSERSASVASGERPSKLPSAEGPATAPGPATPPRVHEPAPPAAREPAVVPYRVQRGDSLWRISAALTGDGRNWRTLWPDGDRRRLVPGMVVEVPLAWARPGATHVPPRPAPPPHADPGGRTLER